MGLERRTTLEFLSAYRIRGSRLHDLDCVPSPSRRKVALGALPIVYDLSTDEPKAFFQIMQKKLQRAFSSRTREIIVKRPTPPER